jgi:hypothetical protein
MARSSSCSSTNQLARPSHHGSDENEAAQAFQCGNVLPDEPRRPCQKATMRKALLDRSDDVTPDIRRNELRLEAAEAGNAAFREAKQALGPPAGDLVGDHRIVKAA